jgi:hypothetical protein
MIEPARQAQLRSLAIEAISALKQLQVDRARLPIERLTAEMPNDPRVLSLRRWAAVLECDCPAKRETIALSRREPLASDCVDLVVFYVDMPTVPSGLHKPTDYLAVVALSFEAAKRRAPQARRVLLTDERTRIPNTVGAQEIIRMPVDAGHVMYERMRAQEQFLAIRSAGRATIFMDVDIVPNQDPAPIFNEDFDVGLTWRPEPEAPINGGLIFVGPGEQGRSFLQRCVGWYDALAADPRVRPLFEHGLRAWWGDQYVLASLVGYRHFASQPPPGVGVDGTRVRLLSSAEFNFVPDPDCSDTAQFMANRYFVHFKGNRKPLQLKYVDYIRAAATA